MRRRANSTSHVASSLSATFSPVCLCPFSFIKTCSLLCLQGSTFVLFFMSQLSHSYDLLSVFVFFLSVTSAFVFGLPGRLLASFPSSFPPHLSFLSMSAHVFLHLCTSHTLPVCLSTLPRPPCSVSPCLSCLYVPQDRPVHPRSGV